MPTTRTRADALALYLTGSASDGGTQGNPAYSLGGYRSGTRAGSLGHVLSGRLAGVRVDHAAGGNGTGTGDLAASDANSVRWTPPGGAMGEPVTIPVGESRVVEGGDDPDAYLVVTRTSASALSGSYAVTLVPVYNDVVGGADQEVGIAGPTYRCLCLKNGGASVVRDLKVWLGENTGAVAIAIEEPDSQPDGAFQIVADEDSAPSGLTFVSPTSAAHVDVIEFAELRPGEQVAVWVERDDTAAADPVTRAAVGIAWSYTAVG